MWDESREMRVKKAAFGGVAFPKGEVLLNPYRLEKTGFSCFSFLYV